MTAGRVKTPAAKTTGTWHPEAADESERIALLGVENRAHYGGGATGVIKSFWISSRLRARL